MFGNAAKRNKGKGKAVEKPAASASSSSQAEADADSRPVTAIRLNPSMLAGSEIPANERYNVRLHGLILDCTVRDLVSKDRHASMAKLSKEERVAAMRELYFNRRLGVDLLSSCDLDRLVFSDSAGTATKFFLFHRDPHMSRNCLLFINCYLFPSNLRRDQVFAVPRVLNTIVLRHDRNYLPIVQRAENGECASISRLLFSSPTSGLDGPSTKFVINRDLAEMLITQPPVRNVEIRTRTQRSVICSPPGVRMQDVLNRMRVMGLESEEQARDVVLRFIPAQSREEIEPGCQGDASVFPTVRDWEVLDAVVRRRL